MSLEPQADATPSTPAPIEDRSGLRRRRSLIFIAASALLTAMAVGLWWWQVARWQATTSDAYVGADLAQVSAQVAGTVKAVFVHTGQQVRAGDVLVELDDTDARIALAQAEAQLAKAVRGVRGLSGSALAAHAAVAQRHSDAAATAAQLQEAQAAQDKAESELARQADLAARGFVSPESLTTARAAVATARAARDAAQAALESAQAATGQAQAQATAASAQVLGGPLESQPDVALAAATVRQAVVALSRTRILAPVGGVAGPRAVQLGAHVTPGSPIVSIAPLNAVWVDANFKETDLAALRVGQKATLTADVYGSSITYRGLVAGTSPATGSALSLLPAQNATGNWIKVVQRVPVRIWLQPEALASHPLQVGLSVNVTVDVHDQQGPRLGILPAAAAAQRTPVFDLPDLNAQARVARIVAANMGR
jgi:membrane fusion protein (multidrug efflux system)